MFLATKPISDDGNQCVTLGSMPMKAKMLLDFVIVLFWEFPLIPQTYVRHSV